MDVARDSDGCTRSARRRRQRRMRSWWRHAQQSIRMAMATVVHHSFGPVHTKSAAGDGPEGGEQRDERRHGPEDSSLHGAPLDLRRGRRGHPAWVSRRDHKHGSRSGPLACARSSRLRRSCLWMGAFLWTSLLSSASSRGDKFQQFQFPGT